jgi:predicted AAA+ superfamily ATPase
MMQSIQLSYQRLLAEVSLEHHRALYDSFNLSNRLTGLVGARGVGKTTLMLQFIKEKLSEVLTSVFYFSADHIYFSSTTLYSFIEDLYLTQNIRTVFIDEIHKYPNWNQELKNLYDGFPQIRLVFSGSSSLDLVKGSYDLSRRAHLFYLPGLSFREYINFTTHSDIPPIPLAQLLTDYQRLDSQIPLIPKIKGLFKEFLQQGYYPFYYEDPLSYYQKILTVVDKTIYEDIAEFYKLKTENLVLFKKLLNYLATIPPGQVSVNNIAKNVGVDAKTVANYLDYMNATGLIRLIYAEAGGNKGLSRPEKIFLNNTNLQYALNNHLGPDIEVGTIRELFFIQSLTNAGIDVFYSPQGDYHVNGTVFEIGGKNKKTHQLAGLSKALLVKDDILCSSHGVIPLLYFGFLY